MLVDESIYTAGGTRVSALRTHFAREDYVRFPGFIREDALEVLKKSVTDALQGAHRRDFLMECMDNSPRRMHVVNAYRIQARSSLISDLYKDPSLIAFLAEVAGKEVTALEGDIDRFVINHLDGPGDTFGAHFDDYPLSLAIVTHAPDPRQGGVPELKRKASSLAELEDAPVRVPLYPGDAYLLRSDTTAHRVSPLLADTERTAINLAYSWHGFVVKETVSAQRLYDLD